MNEDIAGNGLITVKSEKSSSTITKNKGMNIKISGISETIMNQCKQDSSDESLTSESDSQDLILIKEAEVEETPIAPRHFP